MNNTPLVQLLALTFLIFTFTLSFKINALEVKVSFIDEAGKGFFNEQAFTPISSNNAITLGEARRNIVNKVITMIETQFHSKATVYWSVKFQENEGFLALTWGPSMSEFSGEVDTFGMLEAGRFYPNYFPAMLNENESYQPPSYSDPTIIPDNATTEFGNASYLYYGTDKQENQHRFFAVVLHELVHVLGFAQASCLADCFPSAVARPSHFSKYVFAAGEFNTFLDNLDTAEQTKASSDSNTLYFQLSDALRQELSSNVDSGVDSNGILLHTDSESDGGYDYQSIGHLSENVQPEQLMHSVGKDVTKLGAAAHIMCTTGWCRGEDNVVDLSLSFTQDKPFYAPSEPSIIEITVNNLSAQSVENLMLKLKLNQSSEDIVTLLPKDCSTEDNIVLCSLGSITGLESKLLSFEVTSTKEFLEIESSIRAQSYVVDKDGFNNVSYDSIAFKAIEAPDIQLDVSSANITAGSEYILAVLSSDPQNLALTHQWNQISGEEVEFTYLESGTLTVKTKSSTTDLSIVFELTADNGYATTKQTVELKIIGAKETSNETGNNTSSESSGGSVGLGMLLLFFIRFFDINNFLVRRIL